MLSLPQGVTFKNIFEKAKEREETSARGATAKLRSQLYGNAKRA